MGMPQFNQWLRLCSISEGMADSGIPDVTFCKRQLKTDGGLYFTKMAFDSLPEHKEKKCNGIAYKMAEIIL